VIRFSAFLVVVAVGLLVAGVVTSKLLLVYIAIGVSGVALLALGIGAAVQWRELTATPKTAEAETSAQGPASVSQVATAQVGAAAPARAGYLPSTEPPLRPRPADPPRPAASFTPRPEAPPPAVWEWRDAPTDLFTPARPSAPAQPPANAPEPPRDRPPAEDKPAPPQPKPAPPQPKPAPPQPKDTAKPASSTPEAPSDAKPEPPPKAEPAPPDATVTDIPAETPKPAAEQAEEAEPAKEPAGPDPAMEVTVVPGVPRYHKARCILIRFMGDSDLDKMTLAAAKQAGCTPCRACLPDQPGKSA
jgi:hypothetical protein